VKRVPVNLITGFLGVGKTTAVRHLLASKPANEYWAVLVNEFGEVGIDGAAIASMGDGLNVVEVPGGCICCTTSPMLRVSLTKLLRAKRPDRLLIEPSGLGHPAGIVDVLRDPFLAAALELRAIITLVDPRQLDDTRYTLNETWRDQIALADVLVANKCDRADAAQVDRFNTMAAGLYPPKQAWVTTSQGEVSLDVLDIHREDMGSQATTLPAARLIRPAHKSDATLSLVKGAEGCVIRDNQVGHQASRGWVWLPEQRFSAERLAALFQRLHDGEALALPTVARAKGVFHTDHGWLLFNWVNGEASAMEIAWRRDSRAEVIVDSAAPDWSRFEAALFDCRNDPQ
jgi:G3E family GTPase